MVPAHAAATAKILLRAMARSGEGGRSLVAPVSIQDRTLSVGPVALLPLPAVHWLNDAEKAR
jgi:Uncharacterized protein conserved in bacteria (DUF2125)